VLSTINIPISARTSNWRKWRKREEYVKSERKWTTSLFSLEDKKGSIIKTKEGYYPRIR
jgi:hypothetical protein